MGRSFVSLWVPTLCIFMVSCEKDEDCRHDPRSCDDGNACTDDICDMQTGQCRYSAKRCSDDNPCTVDSCDPVSGCLATPVKCDPAKGDRDPCKNMPDCNDGNPCAERFFCKDGACTVELREDGALCDDGDPCTENDICKQGDCIGTQKDCDDGNSATLDYCDSETGECVHKQPE